MTRYLLGLWLLCSSLTVAALETNFSTENSTLQIPEMTIDQLPIAFDVDIQLSFTEGLTGNFEITGFSIDPIIPIQVLLNGAQTVPPLMSMGAGLATLEVNQETGAIKGMVLLEGFGHSDSTQVTAAHIHVGGVGETGPVALPLPGNNHIRKVPNNARLSSEQLNAFLNNDLYINIHTQANPAGEIRGQILAQRLLHIYTELDSSQTVPPTPASAGSGTAMLTVNLLTGELSGEIMVEGLDEISNAHIHQAIIGENGPVVVPLDIIDNSRLVVPEGTRLNALELTALLRGRMYYNVHTPASPSGEIRGQIERPLK